MVATSFVTLWLWLVILPARVAKLCPEECWCEPGGYHVDCSSSSLNNIPFIFPTNVQELVLYDNNIMSIEKDSFITRGLTELRTFVIDYCQLETIQLGAFNELTELIHMSVVSNDIREIIPRTFETMSSLDYLDLRENRIEHLEIYVFAGLFKLKHKDFEGNQLKYVHPDTFVGLHNLIYLHLPNNPDLQISNDRHFITSHSLSQLLCSVSSVSVETFTNVSALEWLDLRSNNLRSVDVNVLKVLPKLSEMYLEDNPL
jgi:Leucine-rich repeat (LRR) protein